MEDKKPQKPDRIICSRDGCPQVEVVESTDQTAYVAGLIDAEGSFYITSDKYPAISVYNNNIGLLEIIQRELGGGLHKNHRGEGHLRITGYESMKKACDLLIPRLICKKRQAEVIMESYGVPSNQRKSYSDRVRVLNAKDDQPDLPKELAAKKIRTSKIPSDWAYFAGMIDGDATIIFQRQVWRSTEYFYPQLHVYSVKPDPLLWLQERFGGQFESRRRPGNVARISALSFEDQVYVERLFEALRPHIVDKLDHVNLCIEAMRSSPPNERKGFELRIKELNSRHRGLHKFTKTADGKYVDGKRSKVRPHKTHKGIPISDINKGNPGEGSDSIVLA